jgi:chromosome segregation ATPase
MAEKRKLQKRIDDLRHKCNLLWETVDGLKIQLEQRKQQLKNLKEGCKEDNDSVCQYGKDKEKQIAAIEANIKKNEKMIDDRKASIAKLEKKKKALGISPLKL